MDPAAHLGLAPNENRLVPYDRAWPELYVQEAGRLAVALGSLIVDVQHYGSTAVPQIRAKPIIDILVGVRSFADGLVCRAPLEAMGYDHAEHAGVPGHHVFGRPRNRQFLVHVVEHGSVHWTRPLAFRDFLRADDVAKLEYEEGKLEAARAAPEGRAAYNEHKGPLIARLLLRMERPLK
jgi:GrpB-like predicted nucleotidyltransferase (UPF0157 family)